MKLSGSLLACLLLGATLAACGLKGPLYLPDGEEPAIEVGPESETEDDADREERGGTAA